VPNSSNPALPPAPEMRLPEDHQLPAGKEQKLLQAPDHDSPGHDGYGQTPGRPPARLRWIVTALVILLLAALAFGLLRHYHQQKVVEAAAKQEEASLPVVSAAQVTRSPSLTSQLLPGNTTPLTEAYLYARATGYVTKRLADIGDRVKKGQLLAVIEAPDLDQQVRQARASLSQAEHQVGQAQQQLENALSQEQLAKVTWERYKVLLEHGAVARQDADQQYTNYKSASATVGAAQANVNAAQQNVQANRANLDRLIALQSFEYIRAPFTGVITARNFDVGALINGSGGSQGGSTTPNGGTELSGAAGNAGASGSAPSATSSTPGSGPTGSSGELFRMAQIGVLRILINVPQDDAHSIRVGEHATVFVQNFPNHRFDGQVTRTANSVDLVTRTMLTEVDVPNPEGILFPGMYGQVQLENVRANPPLVVPGDSLITNANGLQVAVLTDIDRSQENARNYPPDARRIHIRNVQVGRDYGAEIEITSGLQQGEYVVLNPSDDVQEGAIVKPAVAAPTQGQQPGRSPSEREPGGLTPEQPGASDSHARGASTPAPGQQGGKGGQRGKSGGSSKSGAAGKSDQSQ